MAKPTITTRASKGSALSWTEGDSNLTNLRDATISVTDGTNTATLDLNDTLTLTAGSNTTIAVDSATKTATISSTGGGATNLDGLSDVVITAGYVDDLLRFDGTNWVDTAANSITVGAASTVTMTGGATTTGPWYLAMSNTTMGTGVSLNTDTGVTYNGSTNALSATTFIGALNGNATTATGATNINISTNTGNANDTALQLVMVATTATGNQLPHTDTALTWDAANNDLTLGASGASSAAAAVLYSNGTGSVTVGAPTGLSGAITFTLPGSNGTSGQFLTTNGSGATSWSNNITSIAATGSISANSSTANSPKLVIGANALSSTAWTTSGIGIRASAATYTDTSSVAGTVAASHIHAIAAPTMASTNAITVTDAATLYVANRPTAGTNTTITNGWAILTPGDIKAANMTLTGALTGAHNGTVGATTPNTGAFTTLSASSTVSGTGFSNYLASPPAIGSTAASTGAFTTLSATTTDTTGALNVTYNPSSTSGAAINASGKDSQGGTGYFDFFKATNTSAGATNANKTFRINSTGNIEIINSAYTGNIFNLSDAGAMTVGGTTFPTATGTNGQVLTANGSGGSSWTTVSGVGGATNLDGLSDVVITAAATNDILRFDGTNWVDTPKADIFASPGPIGSTAASTGAFTTLSASSTVSGTGFSTYLASPPAIGSTAASTGAFTNLTVTGTVNAGGSNGTSGQILSSTGTGVQWITSGATFNPASPGAIGGTTPAAGTFTTLTANGTSTTIKLSLPAGNWQGNSWTTDGIGIRVAGGDTANDNSSLSGATIATRVVHSINNSFLSSTNPITVTDAATLYVPYKPGSGTNTTITNGWSILAVDGIKAGRFYTTGNIQTTNTLNVGGLATLGALTVGVGGDNTISGSLTVSPSNQNITMSPTGTGTITFNPATAGTINNMSIGATTASTGRFTTVTSTVATGTAPFTVTSTTKVANLNVEQVDGYHADTANTVSTIAVRDASGIITASGFTGAHNGTLGATTPSTIATTQLSYAGTGTGGTITQLTSRTTGVTLNKITGAITLVTTTATASSTTSFVLTNSLIASTDHVIVTHASGGTPGLYFCTAVAGTGGATIYVRHVGTATSPSEAPVLKFTVIKSVNA